MPADRPARPVRHDLAGAAVPRRTWTYAAGTPRYDWTAAAIDGARAAEHPLGRGRHAQALLHPRRSTPATSAPTYQPADQQEGRPRAHTATSTSTSAAKQLGTRTGCASLAPGTFDADCVADGDATMNQGAGTVFATSGPAGRSSATSTPPTPRRATSRLPRRATRTRPTASWTSTATADDLDRPVRAGRRGTFTDAFVIHHGAPPPNAAPTAAFTSSTDGPDGTFDGRGSSDPEGPIAAYSWDFGDGTPRGSGAQPSHTYATAGTYRSR